ncbi:MAG: citramalate synthase [Candidatus Nanopelagicales bacterium]|nr:citramalate synthase [Candidatus Nanopelagicales bacterium]
MNSPSANQSREHLAVEVYDTTLRDGAQREGITYSVADKLAVARLIDEFGVGYIEGGWPGAMPKDTEFFARAVDELELRRARLVAFGATRRAGVQVEDDPQVRALIESQAPIVTLVAKSDVVHVERALRTTRDENVAMVADTVAYLVSQGREVFVDLEHFFDGFRHDSGYGVTLLDALGEAGARVGVLCDTNGGMLPSTLGRVVADVAARTTTPLGIHCQDDTGCAVANTIAAVEAGAIQVQCTANGYGERTGNADLFAVVANLQLKLGIEVVPPAALSEMVRISHAIADLANLAPDTHQPYVGSSSFAHKAGLHASALRVDPELYNHLDPTVVGNDMRVLVTEMAGRASVELKGRELGLDLADQPEVLTEVTERVKRLESAGWTFEAADASFELLVRDAQSGERTRPFAVESWRVIVEQTARGDVESEATVKLRAGDRRVAAVGEGNGPVNALDNALRTALNGMFPELAEFHLTDYKVRIVDGVAGTGAVTRVLVDTTDGHRNWTTVGVHENVIAASWMALEDAVAYGLLGHDLPGADGASS